MPGKTKDRILGEALKIFSGDGCAGANLKDITEAADAVKSDVFSLPVQ